MTDKSGKVRKEVKNLIAQAKDESDAANLICVYFDDLLDMNENGWFDNDSLFEFIEDEDEDETTLYDDLYERMLKLKKRKTKND